MTRAITAGELAKLRSHGQKTRLYLAIEKPTTVFSCRVNQSFTTSDDVSEVIYDSSSGLYTDILAGMTCYVGSTAGAYDKGMVRIRKAATSARLYFGSTSEIQWADNLYLTVVNEFGLWNKRALLLPSSDYLIDEDIAYSTQHSSCNPVPVLGPLGFAKFFTSGTVNITPDASASWVSGSTISSYSWSAPGASATSGMTTATPTITYNTAGQYGISCTVTAANGKTSTGYRKVFIFDTDNPPTTQFRLDSCSGSAETGGWNFEVTLYDEATLSDIRERALVLLFAEDWYNGTKESLGPVTGSENLVCAGWIVGESIEYDYQVGTVRFRVEGPAGWMQRLVGQTVWVKNTTTTPDRWTRFLDLTLDKYLFHLLYWRSTVMAVMDVSLSGLTAKANGFESEADSLWEKIRNPSQLRLLATPVVDHFGRLYVQRDTEYLVAADRTAIPTVQSIGDSDWQDRVSFEYLVVPPAGMVDASGIIYTSITSFSYVFSRAPGKLLRRFGLLEMKDNLAVLSQAELNSLAGMELAKLNNPYPRVHVQLAQNNRFIDICPRQYVTLSMAAGDTPRELVWSAQKLIPREVIYKFDGKNGVFTVELSLDAETIGVDGVAYTRPQKPIVNNPPGNPKTDPPIKKKPWDPWTPGGENPPPQIPSDPEIPDGGDTCRGNDDAPENGPYLLWMSGTIINGQPLNSYLRAWVRSASATHKTTVAVTGIFESSLDGITWTPDLTTSAMHFKAFKDTSGYAELLAEATWGAIADNGIGTRLGTLAPVAGNDIYGVQFYLDSVESGGGAGIPITYIGWGRDNNCVFVDAGLIYLQAILYFNSIWVTYKLTVDTPLGSGHFRITKYNQVISGSGNNWLSYHPSSDIWGTGTPSWGWSPYGGDTDAPSTQIIDLTTINMTTTEGYIMMLYTVAGAHGPLADGTVESRIRKIEWVDSLGNVTEMWSNRQRRIQVTQIQLYNICEHTS